MRHRPKTASAAHLPARAGATRYLSGPHRAMLPTIYIPKGRPMAAARPEDRAMIARIASHSSWAKTHDRTARTAPARAAFLDRFERQVDPDGKLPPEERAQRADSARRAYFARLALKSARARRRLKTDDGRPSRRKSR